jgi:hypothetical protein
MKEEIASDYDSRAIVSMKEIFNSYQFTTSRMKRKNFSRRKSEFLNLQFPPFNNISEQTTKLHLIGVKPTDLVILQYNDQKTYNPQQK